MLNGSMLEAMGMIEKSEVISSKFDLTESQVMSDLMINFPPISKEDPSEVLVQYVAQYLLDTGKAIAWDRIPPDTDAPMKFIKRKRKQIESDKEEEEPKK